MDVALFERIIAQVAPLTELVCFHLMGEPLVHPKLESLFEICQKYDAKVFFVSNGVLLTEKRAELLLNPTIHQVNFSLHSYADNYPEKDPGEYLEKIFKFTETALLLRPELYINFRLWNLDSPEGTKPSNQVLREAIEKRFNLKLESDVNVKVQKSQKLKGRLYLHYDTEFIWPALDLPVLGSSGTCYGLTSHFGILVDGTVVPCCLDKEGNIPLGNINETSIHEILDSEKAMSILNGFQNRKLIDPLCQRCNYITRFGVN